MKQKNISIKNVNDYKIFLKHIRLYKSFLYNNTHFVIINTMLKNNNIDPIINALNIKNRKQRIN